MLHTLFINSCIYLYIKWNGDVPVLVASSGNLISLGGTWGPKEPFHRDTIVGQSCKFKR